MLLAIAEKARTAAERYLVQVAAVSSNAAFLLLLRHDGACLV